MVLVREVLDTLSGWDFRESGPFQYPTPRRGQHSPLSPRVPGRRTGRFFLLTASTRETVYGR